MNNKSIKIIASILALSIVMNFGLMYKVNEADKEIQGLFELLVLTQGVVVSLQTTNNYCLKISLGHQYKGIADIAVAKQDLTVGLFGKERARLAKEIDNTTYAKALYDSEK